MGKSPTGALSQFDTEEVWGVNNVADHPPFDGALDRVTITETGTGYTSARVTVTGGQGEGALVEVQAIDGQIKGIKISASGRGYENPVVTVEGDGTGCKIEATAFPNRHFHKLFAFDFLEQGYTDGMKKHAPICSWQPYSDIHYPIDEVIADFNSRFFTNTVSYMVALAGYLKVKTVKVFGVDVSFGAPYAQENRGVEYWIGRAQERGCNVIAPPESHLMRTVTGVMYGVQDSCNMQLHLSERINLINMLPKAGRYSDALKAQNAWWVLFPKEDEAKAHNVTVQRQADGNLSFSAPSEFVSDVQMPPEVWEYLKTILRETEAAGQLPFSSLTMYEKLVLNQENPHSQPMFGR
jgi:hypothetical protein